MIYFSDFAEASGIAFVGSKSYSGLGNADISVTTTGLAGGIDTQARSGDLVIMAVFLSESVGTPRWSLSSDPGFVSRVNQTVPDTRDSIHQVWTLAAASDAPSVTLTNPASPGGTAVIIYVFRNATYGSVTAATGADTPHTNPPSITPTVAGSWIFVHGGTAHNLNAITYNSIPDLTTVLQASGDNSGNFDASSAAGLKTDWTSGAFNPGVWNWNGAFSTFFSWAAASIVIEPV